MKIVRYDKFLETVLSIPLLKTKTKGKERGNILVNKLKDEDPKLTLNNGDKVDIDPENAKDLSKEISTGGVYDSDKGVKTFLTRNRYDDVIKDEEGNKYKLNQFKKDTEFGSSGAGVNTRNYENLQCIYLAHKLVRPDVPLTDVNIVKLLDDYKDSGTKIAERIHLHLPNIEKVDDFLLDALESPDWRATLEEVTHDLYEYKSRNVSLFSKNFIGKYHVYHISCKEETSPFNIIRNKFNSLLKGRQLKIEFSKYCPADVIVSLDDVNIAALLDNVEGMDDIKEDGKIIKLGLTGVLNDLFSKRLLIPISLKKVGKTVNSVKTYSIIVNNELDRPLPEFEIEKFFIYNDVDRGIASKIKVNSSWRDAKNNEIDGEDRMFTIDSANTSNKLNVDGEVQGKFSRHGKISFTYMKYFIESLGQDVKLPELNTYKELSELSEKVLISKIESIFTKINDLYEMNSKILSIIYPKKPGTEISTGRPIGDENRKNKLISKLQSLQIVLSIMLVRIESIDNGNELMNKIMRYALSIKADIYETPRYVRVI
jgi:hypothetical protein